MTTPAESKPPKFTAKQKRFIEEYCTMRRRKGASSGEGFNATQAAMAAGYSKKSAHTQGWDLLQKPEIKAEIDARMAKLASNSTMKAEEILERLTRIGRASIMEVVEIKEGVFTIKDTKDWPEGFSECVSEVSRGADGQLKIKLESRLTAHELLGKWHKMWTEKRELAGPNGGPLEVNQTVQFALPQMGTSSDPGLPEENGRNEG